MMATLINITMLFCIIFALRLCAVKAESPDYCLASLNTSDCGRSPTPVFYYDKPGSTCKIAMWRGCQSQNMFDRESKCTKICCKDNKIAHEGPEQKSIQNFVDTEIEEEKSILCNMIWNRRNCSKPPEEVYTYDREKKECIKILWYGCPTLNKFDDQKSCVRACVKYQYDWNARMEKLNTYLIKGIETDAINLVKETLNVDKDNITDNGTDYLNLFWLALKENLPLGSISDYKHLFATNDNHIGKRNKREG